MKAFNLFTIVTTSLLVLAIPSSALGWPLRNFIDESSNGDNNNVTTGGNNNNNNSTDLGKFNGTWYVISMEEDIYKEMQNVAMKYNTTCTCPQLTLSPAGPVALNANASCTLQTNESHTQVLSYGLLTLLPDRRSIKKGHGWNQRTDNQTSMISQEYSFALLFSRLYIDSNDTTLDHSGNQSNHLINLQHQGVQLPSMDSGIKGNLFWSFFSSKNDSSLDDIAFVRSKHMISGDDKNDVPDINMLLSKSQDLFDDSIYNETAPSIPGLGANDYKYDYVKLDKCNSTGETQQPTESSGGGNQSATSEQPTTTQENGQPTETTNGDGGQPTETTNGGGEQPTETNNGDGIQSTETNNGDQ